MGISEHQEFVGSIILQPATDQHFFTDISSSKLTAMMGTTCVTTFVTLLKINIELLIY